MMGEANRRGTLEERKRQATEKGEKIVGIQIVISMDDQGGVNIKGPLENKILCFGLLEVAKQIVQEFGEKSKNVIVPKFIPPFAKN